jgi:hypothetical protein
VGSRPVQLLAERHTRRVGKLCFTHSAAADRRLCRLTRATDVSTYIRILNKIKSATDTLRLTSSQEACRARIEERLSYPGVVNLYGSRGTGKTFLGWKMSAENRAVYVVHPYALPQITREISFTGDTIAFIDNVGEGRLEFRKVLIDLESADNLRAIIVTRHPADDYVFRAELELTEADIDTVRQNLRRLGFSIQASEWRNLWDGLLKAAGVQQ